MQWSCALKCQGNFVRQRNFLAFVKLFLFGLKNVRCFIYIFQYFMKTKLILIVALWCHIYGTVRSWSTLLQAMAWCLMAPSHYLNRCWQDSVTFIPGQCLLDYSRYQSLSCVSNLHIWNHSHISQGPYLSTTYGNNTWWVKADVSLLLREIITMLIVFQTCRLAEYWFLRHQGNVIWHG